MSSPNRLATLSYGPNGFRVLTPGDHVVCAVTAERIPLEALRYWSARLQEPYASPEIATKRLLAES